MTAHLLLLTAGSPASVQGLWSGAVKKSNLVKKIKKIPLLDHVYAASRSSLYCLPLSERQYGCFLHRHLEYLAVSSHRATQIYGLGVEGFGRIFDLPRPNASLHLLLLGVISSFPKWWPPGGHLVYQAP